MGTKLIDLKQPVHSLCAQYPELIEILAQIGYADITKPGMLASAGRFMTIPKGAAFKKLDLDMIKSALAGHGFTVVE